MPRDASDVTGFTPVTAPPLMSALGGKQTLERLAINPEYRKGDPRDEDGIQGHQEPVNNRGLFAVAIQRAIIDTARLPTPNRLISDERERQRKRPNPKCSSHLNVSGC